MRGVKTKLAFLVASLCCVLTSTVIIYPLVVGGFMASKTNQYGSLLQSSDDGWTNKTTATGPPILGELGMAYDNESDRTILFGGGGADFFNGDISNETWAYDCNTNSWVNKSPTIAPGARSQFGTAYDSESDRVIIFGGIQSVSPDFFPVTCWRDTWAYDFNNDNWTKMSPTSNPGRIFNFKMAYDVESDRVILFGGTSEGAAWQDSTWAYDFNTDSWTNMNPTTHPPGTDLYGLAYDTESDRVILFGGNKEATRSATWAYDYNTNTWSQRTPETSPPGRFGCAMAYSEANDTIVLFGGAGEGQNWNDTWAYDYNEDTWQNVTTVPCPSAKFGYRMVYDIESDQMILYGGSAHFQQGPSFKETWAYKYYIPIGNIIVHVTDAFGSPLEDASVISASHPSPQSQISSVTNSTGYCEFLQIYSGVYTLNTTKVGYDPNSTTFTLAPGETKSVAIQLTGGPLPWWLIPLIVGSIAVIAIVTVFYFRRRS